MERLNYNQLFYFYVVATEGSIKAACEKLHLTQPTISGQLKTLEDNLGCRLFEREHRRLKITDIGKEILRKAEKIFAIGDELVMDLDQKQSPLAKQQPLRLGVSKSVPQSITNEIVQTIANISAQPISVQHSSSSRMQTDLDEDNIDILVSDSPMQHPTNYRMFILSSYQFAAIASESFATIHPNFPHSLNGQSYISLANQSMQSNIDFFFRESKIKPELLATIDSIPVILDSLCQINGFSILPDTELSPILEDRKLKRLGEVPHLNTSVWVISSKIGSRKLVVRKAMHRIFQQSKEAEKKTAA